MAYCSRTVVALSTAQIGKCGELLVQYRLLLLGVESAPMSTETGIDLIAYSPATLQPVTIQVKTNLKPKPGVVKESSLLIGGFQKGPLQRLLRWRISLRRKCGCLRPVS